MRYIDADKIVFWIKYVSSNGMLCDTDVRKVAFSDEIARMPTADVVEVVRCKDCRFNTFTQPNGTIHCHVDGNVRFSKQDDFCSKGRRKEQTDG